MVNILKFQVDSSEYTFQLYDASASAPICRLGSKLVPFKMNGSLNV